MGIHLERARQLYCLRRYDLAEKESRAELAAEPGNVGALVLLGQCLMNLDRCEEAREAVEEAIHLSPDHSYAHYILSHIYQKQKDGQEAEKAAREALRLSPTSSDYLGHLAYLCNKRGCNDEALRLADEGLRRDANHVACLQARASALGATGQYSEAHAVLKHALERDPENQWLFATLGWLMLLEKKPTHAIENYRESLRLDPQSQEIQELLKKTVKEQVLLRFVVIPSGVAFAGGILLTVLRYQFTEQPPNSRLAIFHLLLPILAITIPTGLYLESWSMSRLIRVHHFWCGFPPALLGPICRECLGSLLTVSIMFAALWCDSGAIFLPAVVAWLVSFILTALSARESSGTWRSFVAAFTALVYGVGLLGITSLASGIIPFSPTLQSCSSLGYLDLAFYLLGSFYVAAFIHISDTHRERNPTP